MRSTTKTEQAFLSALGIRIAELRKEKGLTQEQVASAADLHRTYIGFIEQGRRNPLVGNIFKISEALGVSPRTLFEPFDETEEK